MVENTFTFIKKW